MSAKKVKKTQVKGITNERRQKPRDIIDSWRLVKKKAEINGRKVFRIIRKKNHKVLPKSKDFGDQMNPKGKKHGLRRFHVIILPF